MAVDALEFAGGVLRIAGRVLLFLADFFVDFLIEGLGRLILRASRREASDDACVLVGVVALAVIALVVGVIYMAL